MLLLTQTLPFQVAADPWSPGDGQYTFRVDDFAYDPAATGRTTITAAAVAASAAPPPAWSRMMGASCSTWTPCRVRPDPGACCAEKPEGCDSDCMAGRFVGVTARGPPVAIPPPSWLPTWTTKPPPPSTTNKPTHKPSKNKSGAPDNTTTTAAMTPTPPPSPPASKSVGEPPAGALVAETLADFDSVDDSLVFPRGAGPEIQNITQVAPRTFNFELRHRGNPWSPLNPRGTKGAWYDGDRDLQWNEGKRDGKYHDKSRAEVCCLRGFGSKKGGKLSVGETWEMATTVRLDPQFRPSAGYCNIMQPVFDQSFLNLVGLRADGAVEAQLTVFTDGIGSPQKIAREFVIKRGEWTSIVVRVKFDTKGSYQCSVNGDALKGVKLDTTKGRQPFSPKWGLYGSGTQDVERRPLNDSVVQHRNVYMRRVA